VVEELLGDPGPAERAAEALGDADELIAVGRGYLMCVALEAALKLREATGVRAEGWSAADFRHGPVTVARGDIPLLAVSANVQPETYEAALEAGINDYLLKPVDESKLVEAVLEWTGREETV
jgi:glucosamine--fructose-6-phosphate aminotransferase (isomerizing)